jgi:hypothetical protein
MNRTWANSLAVKIRRSPIKLVALAVPATIGVLAYGAAASLVHHDSINYQLHEAGFEFISNAAETIFAAGPVASASAALVFALPSTLLCLRRAGPVFKAATVNMAAAIVFVCGLGSVGFLFAGMLALAPILWIVAMLWAVTRESKQPLQPTPR